MSVTLADLMAFGKKNFGFNDIEFYAGDKRRKPLETQPVTQLVGKEVPGVEAFAEHGSGSLFALWKGHVVWLDSSGDQSVIAKDVDDFVDALLFDTGAIWQVADSCQESDSFVASFRNGRQRTLEQVREGFTPEFIPNVLSDTRERYRDAYEKFAKWAHQHGRSVPTDIVDRMFALRALTAELRAACSTRPAAAPAPATPPTETGAKKVKKRTVAAAPKRSVKARSKRAAAPRGKAGKATAKTSARAKSSAKSPGKRRSRSR